MSCPFTEARVAGFGRGHEWNGQVALPVDQDGDGGLFRTDPAPAQLRPGDPCRVGIPPTVVHVIDVEHYDPPRETGRLPRPRLEVVVLPYGESHDPAREHQGEGLNPGDGIPVRYELLFRPYACLSAGDEVADAAGRAWRFDGPWSWHPFDGVADGLPRWPLTLLTRGGREPAPPEAAEVAQVTAAGGHDDELARWSKAFGATP
ncbi:hypothetical protein [Kitasatospora aureofaciens]|uniref:hypothetical protein n=1 Tax=Kitasatospora aureofaciens TaxID=1894 RepID=UPI0027E1CADF|nr:hypothetical protein [Kitasatospora aureofaciens]